MNETIETEYPDNLTPAQYRAELIQERAEINNRLATIKADIAFLVAEKRHSEIELLSQERAELIADMSDIDLELAKLKADKPKQQPQQSQRHPDLGLIVQLVAAEISNSGLCNVDEAIARLNHIKEKLSAQ